MKKILNFLKEFFIELFYGPFRLTEENKFIDRSLGWLYIRANLVAWATLFMLLLSAFTSFVYFTLCNGNPPKLVYYGLAVPFYVCDIFYNVVFGSFIYLEIPRELIFTKRIARHRNSPYDGPATYSKFACKVLDYFDPGHCNKV